MSIDYRKVTSQCNAGLHSLCRWREWDCCCPCHEKAKAS